MNCFILFKLAKLILANCTAHMSTMAVEWLRSCTHVRALDQSSLSGLPPALLESEGLQETERGGFQYEAIKTLECYCVQMLLPGEGTYCLEWSFKIFEHFWLLPMQLLSPLKTKLKINYKSKIKSGCHNKVGSLHEMLNQWFEGVR